MLPENIARIRIMILFVWVMVGLLVSVNASFLEKLEKPEVREIKARLEEEKAKRLLLQNDVEMLMLKMEQLQRTCEEVQTKSTSALDGMKQGEQIAFSARLSTKTTLDLHHVVVFDQVLHNTGNGYSASTGIFRPPIAGTYVFSLSLLSGGKGLHFHEQIMKSGMEIGRLFSGSDVASWSDQGSVTVVTFLSDDDEVYVRQFSTWSNGTLHGDFFGTFTGFQI